MFVGLEAGILHAVQGIANPVCDLLMLVLTFAGNPAFWFGVAAFIYWKGRRRDSFFLMTLVMCVSAVVGMLKPIIARPRPSSEEFRVLTGDITDIHFGEYSGAHSFPSGHSAMIAAAFGYFSNYVSRNKVIILVLLVLVVAFSRMYLGAHFLSDVIAGLVLGYLIGKGMFFVYDKAKKEDLYKIDTNVEFGIIAMLVVVFAIFVSYQPLALTAIVGGFYAGLFICWQRGIRQKKLIGKDLLVKEFAGFVGLGFIILAAVLNQTTEIDVLLFFLAGFWVSFIWPILFDRVVD